MSKSVKKNTSGDNSSNTIQTSPEIVDSLDKNIFFSVSEAKKRTNLVYKKRLEVEMLPVYTAINRAINDGKYSVDEIVLSDSQKRFLIDKNFGVTYLKTNTYKSSIYKIYWN